MDTTLTYSILAGIVIVLLFVVARLALRWIIKIALVVLLLVAIVGAAFLWYTRSTGPSEAKPSSAGRAGTNRQ